MKIKVLPGEAVVLFIKAAGVERPCPMVAMVHKVHRGTIEVSEEKSHNGIAKIVCHGTSEAKGEFWYEYKDVALEENSFDVVKMTKLDGEQVFGPFIIGD